MESQRVLPVLGLVAFSQVIIFSFVSLLSPFFPAYAREKYHATSLEIGLVFSFYSLAQVCFSPWSSWLCRRCGRLPILYGGLLLLSVSTVIFAKAQSIPASIVARSIQGVGGAMVNVAGYALIMQFSSNVARDIGVMELLTGLAFMIGPVLGAFLYTWLGMEAMFLWLSLVPLGNVVLMMVTIKILQHPESMQEKAPPESSGAWVIAKNPVVLLVVLALVIDAAALGFLDPTLAWHLEAVLGVGIKGVGMIMATTPAIYSFLAMVVGQRATKQGMHYIMSGGLALVAICFMTLGPIPLLSSLPYTHTGAWVLVMASLLLIGLGSALIVVPAVPLMLHALDQDPDCEGDVNDPVSALFMASWAFGDFLGPSIGGAFTQYLPETHEIACKGGGQLCQSPFPWASTLYGFLVLLVSIIFFIGTRSEERSKGHKIKAHGRGASLQNGGGQEWEPLHQKGVPTKGATDMGPAYGSV